MNICFKKTIQPSMPYQQKLLNKVSDYYHKTFLDDSKLIGYFVNEIGIKDKSIFIKHKLGFCNGTLYDMIPADGEVTQALQRAEILDNQGKENYLNCLVMPQLDPEGNCVKIKAIKLTELKQQDLSYLIPAQEPKPSVVLENSEQQIQELKDGLFIRYGERKYMIKGIDASANRLKVNLKAVNQTRFHIDSIDLYTAKQRKAFAKETALLFHIESEITEQDLNRIIETTESYIKNKKDNPVKDYVITDADREQALKFLKSPDIIKQILKDFEVIGYAGEETNKILGYLVAVSRKLDDPLSLLILARSAAGKSTLQDAILELVPDEDKVKYTRITANALFYTAEGTLDHKVIAIEEEEGCHDAAYSLRTMQTSKHLTSATTIKDPLTGEMKTKEYHTKINSALMYTTTNGSIDYETLNRFIITTIDESRKQTELIHDIQRQKDTLEGLFTDSDKGQVIKNHHNAQRLLRPLKVANPFAPYLTFANDRLRARRDHKKYLSLIKAIAFLHQYQREIKKAERHGKAVEYIEVTLNDISFANILAAEVLGRSLDELAPQSRNLLMQFKKMKTERLAQGEQKIQVSRRQLREYTGWSDHQIRDHLQQLIDLEYVAIINGKNGFRFMYELIYDGEGDQGGKFIMGLTDIKTLREKMNTTKASQRIPCA